MPSLLQQLNSPEPDARREAARALRQSPSADTERALVQSLQDASRGVREAAGETLVAIGGAAAVEELIRLLHSHSPGVRNLAIEILIQLGAKAFPAVIELIHDQDPDVRKFAADILGATKLPEGIPVLIRLLADPDPNVLQAAVEALGVIGDRRVVPHILTLLATPGPHWYHAIEALGRIGDPTAVPVLLAGLESADPISAVGILDTVGQLGDRRAYETLLLLTPQVGPPVSDGPNRLKAAALFRALLRLGSHLGVSAPPLPSSVVLPCVDAALTDGDREVVEFALAAYEESIPPAWAPRILALASDNDTSDNVIAHVVGLCQRQPSIIVASLQACPTLWRPILLEGLIAPPTHPVVDALLAGLNEGAFGGQAELVEALGKTGDARVIPTLLTLLEVGDAWLRSRTAEALAKLGAQEAVTPLNRLLREGGEEADLRAYFHALLVITPDVLRRELPSLLSHHDVRVRRVSTETAEPFGNDVNTLLPLLQDPDAQVRRNAVLLLAQHFPPSSDALFLALTDEEATVRRAAIRAVAGLGSGKSLALLESAYDQEMDPLVRYEVVVCLRDLVGVPARTLLAAALNDDAPLVRIAAARAFGVSGDPHDSSVRRQLEARDDAELINFLKYRSSGKRA